ncbi:hypothetical protein LIER_05330 [Lithospermum erythrorhizon]|uniref:Uncharacterized protein n=1 Tax=Lithospermum erythrorhizon TaxID=34254 RepID=A0AAV3P054_LITER
MVTFENTSGVEFSTLRIVGLEEDMVTILAAYTPLYRGCATSWPTLRSSYSERNRSWSSSYDRVLHLKGSSRESSDPLLAFTF